MSGCLVCKRGGWPSLWADAKTREEFRLSACDKHRADQKAGEDALKAVGKVTARYARLDKKIAIAREALEDIAKTAHNRARSVTVNKAREALAKLKESPLTSKSEMRRLAIQDPEGLRRELEAARKVVEAAIKYKEFLPNMEPFGAVKYSSQAMAAWDLRQALTEYVAITQEKKP